MKKITKSELKTADIVVNSKGSTGIVLLNTAQGDLIKWFKNDKNESIYKYRSLNMINEDLTFKYDPGHRIVKVYRPTDKHDFNTYHAYDSKYLLWEEKVKEVTMDELEEMYGCKVKIKK